MTDDQSQESFTEEQADSLLESIEQPAHEMANTQEMKQEPPPPVQEYEFEHSGKKIKAPVDKLLKWASQGYDAPNKIGELNKELQTWRQKESQFKELESKYGDVDNYVRQNPEWWNYVKSQYEQQQQAQQQNPLFSELSALKNELNEVKSFKSQVEQEKIQQKIKEEDSAYLNQLEQIKKTYPTVDLITPDPMTGKSLEYKVLEFANEKGIKDFDVAFKAFYHDELMRMREESAKEKLAQDKISKSKLGILGISSTPTKKISDSVKGKSYNDLEREIREEYGL